MNEWVRVNACWSDDMTVQWLIITETVQNNTNGALNQNGCDFIAFIVMELVGLENRYEGLYGEWARSLIHLREEYNSSSPTLSLIISPHISFPSGHSFIYVSFFVLLPHINIWSHYVLCCFILVSLCECRMAILRTFLQKWAMAVNACSVCARKVWLDFPRPRDRPLKNRAVSSHCYNRASLFIYSRLNLQFMEYTKAHMTVWFKDYSFHLTQ